MTSEEAIKVLQKMKVDMLVTAVDEGEIDSSECNEQVYACQKAIDALRKQDEKTLPVIMSNAEWCVRNGVSFSNLCIGLQKEKHGGNYEISWNKNGVREVIGTYPRTNCGQLDSGETNVALKAWLDAEHKEQILTDEERKYLKQVIAPFRNWVTGIELNAGNICLLSDTSDWNIPASFNFEGMDEGRNYTLLELGL